MSGEKSKTRDGVTELTGYCLIVALHQRFGFGRERLDRLAARVTKISESVGAEMDAYGNARALAKLRGQTEEICCARAGTGGRRSCGVPEMMRHAQPGSVWRWRCMSCLALARSG